MKKSFWKLKLGVLVFLAARVLNADTPPIIYDFQAPLSKTGKNVSIPQASSSQSGFLSSSDWSVFNAKLDASRGNYITNPDAEVNTAGWTLYNDVGRTDPAYLDNQDIRFISTVPGNGGNGVSIQYVYNASFNFATPNINVISSTQVQVRWHNGPTIAANPTATQLCAAWDAVPAAVAIASCNIVGTASDLQYINGASFSPLLSGGGDIAPVNGTGGLVTGVTFTRSTVNPLQGIGSFYLSKDAADRQGMGVATDFQIDALDKGNELQVSFAYMGSSAMVLGVNSDFKMYLYDVTNAAMIPLRPVVYPAGPVLTVKTFTATFDASPTSVNYRFIIHNATTSTAAWDLQLDNFVLSSVIDPEVAQSVPKVSIPGQPILGTVTDHMAVMWQDGNQAWRPATMASATDDTTLWGFAENIVGLTADIVIYGEMSGFSVGPFLGYNQYVDTVAGGVSPLPSPFTDTGVSMGKGVTEETIMVRPRPFTRKITSKGGLLTNAGANNGTGDQVLAGGTTGQFLRSNTALSLGIGWFTPVATAPLVYTASTSTWSCTTATTSVAGCISAASFTLFNNKAPTATPVFTGDVNSSTGSVLVSTAGQGLRVKTGSNAKIGTATLVGGTVTVANTSVTANSRIFYSVSTAGGTQGNLRYTKSAGTSFTITSTSATETSTVDWFIVESIP